MHNDNDNKKNPFIKLYETGVTPNKTRLASIVIGIVALAIVLPAIWYAFLTSLGLAGIAIIGGLGVGLSALLPYLGQKLENEILRIRKAEAGKNPIEQMQNQLIRRNEQLNQLKSALLKIASKIKSLERVIDDRAKSYPGHDLSEMRKSLDAMKTYYQKQKGKLMQAEKTLEEFKSAVEQKIFEHGFAQAGQEILLSMSKTGKESLQQDILTDEAFRSVEAAFDEAFTSLEFQESYEQKIKPFALTDDEPKAESDDNSNPTTKG